MVVTYVGGNLCRAIKEAPSSLPIWRLCSRESQDFGPYIPQYLNIVTKVRMVSLITESVRKKYVLHGGSAWCTIIID